MRKDRRRPAAGPPDIRTPRLARGVLFWRGRAKIAAMPDFMSRVLGPLSPTDDAPTVRGFVAALLLVGDHDAVHRGAALGRPCRAHRRRLRDPGADRGDPLGPVAGHPGGDHRGRDDQSGVHPHAARFPASGLGSGGAACRLHRGRGDREPARAQRQGSCRNGRARRQRNAAARRKPTSCARR